MFVLASAPGYVWGESYTSPDMPHRVRYYLERPKPDVPALILLRFTYRGHTVQVSTQEYAHGKDWDRRSQRVKDGSVRRNPGYLEVNRVLDDLDQYTRLQYNIYRRDHRLADLTPDRLKGMLQAKIMGTEYMQSLHEPTVAEYYDSFLRERERIGNLSTATEASDRMARDWFQKFDAQRRRPTRFADVNLGLFEEYRDYFWSLGDARSDNTIHKRLRQFKQLCLHAAANGYALGGDIRAVQLKSQLRLSAQAMDTIALYEEELEHLAAFDYDGTEIHRECRDLFIAGCCTGLRVNRWPQIDRSNLIERDGHRMLALFTQKGKRKRIVLPLSPMLERIGERYDWKLPKHSPVIINRYIKEVCRAAGMTDKIELARNVRGRSVVQTYAKYELITTHTARRSFATNAHAAGIHLDDIQAMTGHSDRKTLLHYIKEDAERRASRLKALPYYNRAGGEDNTKSA